MRNKTKLFFDFIRRNRFWSFIIVVTLVAITWYFVKNNTESVVYDETIVTKGSISEIVSVTGSVKPFSNVDLAFERGGRVASIPVSVGDKVYVGQSLISVSNDDLLANLDQARANLKKVQAQYTEVRGGTRAEEIALQETQVEKSTLDLAQTKISLINTIKDSFTKADDAVRNKMFSLFTDPGKVRAKLSFTTDQFLRESIENGKDTINDALTSWYQSLTTLDSSSFTEADYNVAKENLDTIKSLLDKCATAVSNLSPDSFTTQTQIDTWKATVSLARTNISGAISSLNSSYDIYKTSASALKISQDQLALKKAGSTAGQIVSAEASYEGALAGVASAEAELVKSIIKSPIDGVVTNINTKLGEIVSANKSVVSVISYGDYEVESYIPEADIAKVKLGDQTKTTLDAYGGDVYFETVVIKIDPAATVIDGVPTYKVTFKFTNNDERVRAGMTANLDVLTNKKDNVFVLPNRLVVNKTDGKYVSVVNPVDSSDIIEKKVVTGLRGYDGNIEIISGLTEGERVIPSITK